MTYIFSLVTLAAAAFACTIFLTTLPNGIPLEPRLNHEATTARYVSDNGCHLQSILEGPCGIGVAHDRDCNEAAG